MRKLTRPKRKHSFSAPNFEMDSPRNSVSNCRVKNRAECSCLVDFGYVFSEVSRSNNCGYTATIVHLQASGGAHSGPLLHRTPIRFWFILLAPTQVRLFRFVSGRHLCICKGLVYVRGLQPLLYLRNLDTFPPPPSRDLMPLLLRPAQVRLRFGSGLLRPAHALLRMP
jgi:hypothetical protein